MVTGTDFRQQLGLVQWNPADVGWCSTIRFRSSGCRLKMVQNTMWTERKTAGTVAFTTASFVQLLTRLVSKVNVSPREHAWLQICVNTVNHHQGWEQAQIGLWAQDNPFHHLPESLFYQWSLLRCLGNLLSAEPGSGGLYIDKLLDDSRATQFITDHNFAVK